MTEAQVATLARRSVVPERDLTWVQASLLIDRVAGTPLGKQATTWLREYGASTEEAARVIGRAVRELREPAHDRPADAVDVRLEVLDGATTNCRRHLSGGETREREALQRWQAAATRDRLRERRQEWARRTSDTEDPSVLAARRRGSGRPPPGIAR